MYLEMSSVKWQPCCLGCGVWGVGCWVWGGGGGGGWIGGGGVGRWVKGIIVSNEVIAARLITLGLWGITGTGPKSLVSSKYFHMFIPSRGWLIYWGVGYETYHQSFSSFHWYCHYAFSFKPIIQSARLVMQILNYPTRWWTTQRQCVGC